jgi:hypothetical protein
MASISEAEEILNAAVNGISRIARTIASLPVEDQAEAFDATERIYLKIVKTWVVRKRPLRIGYFKLCCGCEER